jgi:hypothetical protein
MLVQMREDIENHKRIHRQTFDQIASRHVPYLYNKTHCNTNKSDR